MKLKGISALEASADKITLGVTGLAFVGALALQFVPGRNQIKVGATQQTPGTAFVPVESAARNLLAELDTTNPRLPEEVPQFTLAGKLDLSGPALPATRVAMGVPPRIAKAEVAVKVESGQFELPRVPAPAGPQAYAFSGTFHPVEVLRNADLKKVLLSQDQPFDFHAVSVEAKFDGSALRSALEADPDGDGPQQPIPMSWWFDAVSEVAFVDIVGIEVERQMVVRADGRPVAEAPPELLATPPGRFDSIKMWTENVKSLGDVPGAVDTVRSYAAEVQRPEFYPMIAGADWLPPERAIEAGDPAARQKLIRKLTDDIAQIDVDLADVQKRLTAAEGAAPKGRESERQPVGRPGAGGGGGKGGSGGGGVGPAPTTGPRPAPVGNPAALRKRMETLSKRREDLASRLAGLEQRTPDAPLAAAVPGARPESTLSSPSITLWTHDLTAQPGASYAYRFRVVVNNPAFGRNLQPSQAALAQSSTLRGEWSEWSEAVQVDPQNAVFITSASETDPLNGRPTASAELYQFYYGYYRKGNTGLTPGDQISASETLPEKLKLADLKKLDEFIKANQPIPGAAPVPAPIAPAPGGGGGKTGGTRIDPREAGAPVMPVTPVTAPAEAGPESEWLNVPVERHLQLDSGLVFLDATSAPGSAGGVEVVVVGVDGTLYVRTPQTDTKSPLLERLRSSAQVGLAQGELKPAEIRTPPAGPGNRPPSGPKVPPAGGGMGGGGG